MLIILLLLVWTSHSKSFCIPLVRYFSDRSVRDLQIWDTLLQDRTAVSLHKFHVCLRQRLRGISILPVSSPVLWPVLGVPQYLCPRYPSNIATLSRCAGNISQVPSLCLIKVSLSQELSPIGLHACSIPQGIWGVCTVSSREPGKPYHL